MGISGIMHLCVLPKGLPFHVPAKFRLKFCIIGIFLGKFHNAVTLLLSPGHIDKAGHCKDNQRHDKY
jgi:hypothetical protein